MTLMKLYRCRKDLYQSHFQGLWVRILYPRLKEAPTARLRLLSLYSPLLWSWAFHSETAKSPLCPLLRIRPSTYL